MREKIPYRLMEEFDNREDAKKCTAEMRRDNPKFRAVRTIKRYGKWYTAVVM
jgi:hypothetical protein